MFSILKEVKREYLQVSSTMIYISSIIVGDLRGLISLSRALCPTLDARLLATVS